jgi:hypothetical protein
VPFQEELIVISPTQQIEKIGVVSHFVNSLLIVESDKDKAALDLDSVLCTADRTPLGRISEVEIQF